MPDRGRYSENQSDEHFRTEASVWLIGALIVLVLAGGMYFVWSGSTNRATSAVDTSPSETTGQTTSPSSGGTMRR